MEKKFLSMNKKGAIEDKIINYIIAAILLGAGATYIWGNDGLGNLSGSGAPTMVVILLPLMIGLGLIKYFMGRRR